MKNIIKYNNRKLYDTEASKYINLKELLGLPLGSFKVTEKETGNDITVETLFSYLASDTNNMEITKQTKINVMQHCINVLSA